MYPTICLNWPIGISSFAPRFDVLFWIFQCSSQWVRLEKIRSVFAFLSLRVQRSRARSVECQNCIGIHLNQNDECIDHSLTYHKNFNIVIQYRSTSILWSVETRCCKDFVEHQGAIAYFLRRFDVLDSRRTAGCQLHGIIVFWMQYNFPRCIYVGKTGGNELKAGSFEFIRKKISEV